MKPKYYFLSAIAFATTVFGMPEALIEEFVGKSDIIVIGKLSISHTRNGHIGSIEIEELLYGEAKKQINFISDPIPLIENKSRIWFLHHEITSINSTQWRLCVVNNNSSLPKKYKNIVIHKIKESNK